MGSTTYQYIFHRTDKLKTGLLNEKTLEGVEFLGAIVTLSVRQTCTRVNVVQSYRNAESGSVDATYVFPVKDGWTVSSFEAEMQGTSIKAVIQDREHTHKEYRDGCFIAAVGTLKPGESCTTSIVYVMPTDYDASGDTLEVLLSKDVFPAQTMKDGELLDWKKAFNVQSNRNLPRALRIDLDCSMDWSIETAECNMDGTTLDKQGTQLTGHYECVFQPGEPIGLPDDFKLQMKLADSRDLISVFVVKEEGDIPDDEVYALSLPIVPSFTEEQLLAPNTELVLLIDCSGSMMHRMPEVERCAKLCLQGLPQSVRFNIILYGDSRKTLDESGCLEFNTDNLLWGRSFIHKMDANMGGTNLNGALKAAYDLPMARGYCRQIVLITDGACNKPDESVRLAKENATSTRLFTFHLDPKTDHRKHMEQLSKASGGRYLVIGPGDRLTEPILMELEDLLQPCLVKATLTYSYEGNAMKDAAETAVPPIRNATGSLPLLFSNLRYVSYAFGGRGLEANPVVKLSAWYAEQHLEWTYHIGDLQTGVKCNNTREADPPSVLHIAAATTRIRNLTEFSTKSTLPVEDVDEVLRLSRTFNVVSPLTCFQVAVDHSDPATANRIWTQDHIVKKEIACEYSYELPRHERDIARVDRPAPPAIMDEPRPTIRPLDDPDTEYEPAPSSGLSTIAFMQNIVRGIVHSICRASTVDDLVFTQTAAGNWNMNNLFARSLDSSVQELLQAVPSVHEDVTLVVPAVVERNRRLEEERRRAEEAENEKRKQEEELAIRKAKLEMERQIALEKARAKMSEEDAAAAEEAEKKKKEEEAEKLRAEAEAKEKAKKEMEKQKEKEAKAKEAERKKLVKKLGEDAVRQQEEAEARKAEEEEQRQQKEEEAALRREDDTRALWEAEERAKHITNIWATALALAYLDLNHSDQAQEFALVARRGHLWLMGTGVPNAELWPEQAAAFLKPILEEQAQILAYEREIRERETEIARRDYEAQIAAEEEEHLREEEQFEARMQARKAQEDIRVIADDESSEEEDEESRRQRFAEVEEEERRLAEQPVEEEPDIVEEEEPEEPTEAVEGEAVEGEEGAAEVVDDEEGAFPPEDEEAFPAPTDEQLDELGEEEIEEDVEEEE